MFEFFKRKKETENIKKASPELTLQFTTKLFSEVYIDEKDLNFDDIDKILKDTDVDTAIKKIERAVAGKELIIWSDDEKNRKLIDQIQERFNNVKFNRIFKYFLRARYYGYSCFEKVYNPDYSLNSLVFIPEKYVLYDTLNKKWVIRAGTEEKEINYEKFLLSIHEWNVAEKTGKSIFTGLRKCFLDKEMFRAQLRGLAQKYGDTIIFFGYDTAEDEEDVRKKAEDIKKMQGGKTAIAIPTDDGKLKDNLYILTLSDLDTEVYTKLEDREKERLIQNILGGTLTMESGNGSGSYSLGQIHKESFEEVVEECCSFISDSMQQLLEFDGRYFGYDPKEFYFKLETKKDRDKEIEFETKESQLNTVKIDNILKLNQAGIGLTTEYISSALGIDKKYITEIEKSVVEFASKKDKKKILIDNVKKIFDKRMADSEIKLAEFVKNIKKSVKKWLESDILNENLNLNIDIFEEIYIKTFLFGYTDSLNQRGNKEFQEEIDPFSLKFNEAINYFTKKAPILYEKLDDIINSTKDTFFYIKRSTELEATKRVLESLKKTLENGGTYQEWKQDISDIADKAGLGEDGWYSHLVYRQNMVNAYQSGRYEQQMQDDDEYFSYLLFDGVEDERQTDFCRTYSGKVYKKSDPIWALIYPPNHFNCRSSVIELGTDKIKELGLEISKSKKKELKEIEKEIGDFARLPIDIKDIKAKEKKLVQLKLEIAEFMKEGKK